MKKSILNLVAMATLNSIAQVGVPNLSQVPILMHPSMVGSNGRTRLAAVYGNGTFTNNSKNNCNGQVAYDNARFVYRQHNGIQLFETYQKSNFMLSFDQLSKKIGSGIGGYFNTSKVPMQASAARSYHANYSSFLQYNTNFGLSFAPKYIIKYKDDPSKIKYTWSPSISMNFQDFRLKESLLVPDENKSNLTSIDYLKKENVKSFDLNIGGLINNSSWIFGGTIGYGIEKLNNHQHMMRLENSKDETNTSINVKNFRVSGCIAYSFPKKENSFFNFTPKFKLNLAIPFGELPKKYYAYNGNSANMCLDFRVWNILFGYSITGGNYNQQSSLYLGYKTQNWKAIVGFNPIPKNPSLTTYSASANYSRLMELSFSYQIK